MGGVLNASDANHQIGGMNGSRGREVLRWNIRTLANKGAITGARIKLTTQCVRAEGSAVMPNPVTFRLCRITAANKGWIDGQAYRDRARSGVAWGRLHDAQHTRHRLRGPAGGHGDDYQRQEPARKIGADL